MTIYDKTEEKANKDENAALRLSRSQRRPFQLLLRKARKKAARQAARQADNGVELCNYEYRADDDQVTGMAGMFMMKDMLSLLKVKDRFAELLDIKKRSSRYGVDDLTYLLVEQKIAGINSIEESWRLQYDVPYREMHGLDSYPCAQTFRDHLQKFDMKNVEQLMKVNEAILDFFSLLCGPRAVTVLIDSKVITVYGDQEGAEVGNNPRKPGRKSYCLKLCCLEEFGNLIIHVELCPGTDVSATYFRDYFAECEKRIPKGWMIREVKLDSGYYSEDALNYLESRNLLYTVSAREQGRLKTLAHSVIDEIWKGSPGKKPRIIDMMYKPATWKKERRFIAAKIFIGNSIPQPLLFEQFNWRTQVLVTNRKGGAEECYYGYNGRVLVENTIKELEYGYNAFRQPGRSAVANTANAVLGALAFNLATIAKILFFPDEWKNKTVALVRRLLVQIPAVVSGRRRKIIHISGKYPFMKQLNQLHQNIVAAAVRQYAFG